jgi:hypothetical protein
MTQIKTLLTLLLISGLTLLYIDRKLFFYGRNYFNFYKPLPFNTYTDYKEIFNGGFALRDEHGFSIIHEDKDTLLRYGYDHNEIITQFKDSTKESYHIKIIGNQNPRQLKLDKNAIIDTENYKWINLQDKKSISNLKHARSLLLFTTLILMTFSITSIYKEFKN